MSSYFSTFDGGWFATFEGWVTRTGADVMLKDGPDGLDVMMGHSSTGRHRERATIPWDVIEHLMEKRNTCQDQS